MPDFLILLKKREGRKGEENREEKKERGRGGL
jgi:hypothetical protein